MPWPLPPYSWADRRGLQDLRSRSDVRDLIDERRERQRGAQPTEAWQLAMQRQPIAVLVHHDARNQLDSEAPLRDHALGQRRAAQLAIAVVTRELLADLLPDHELGRLQFERLGDLVIGRSWRCG
ncbi:MAG TPA: hypothetical protein VFG69_12720 [Nannocystaceae bacterium]|nr:hypothetical protein [Nannocystaceae bacterium]